MVKALLAMALAYSTVAITIDQTTPSHQGTREDHELWGIVGLGGFLKGVGSGVATNGITSVPGLLWNSN